MNSVVHWVGWTWPVWNAVGAIGSLVGVLTATTFAAISARQSGRSSAAAAKTAAASERERLDQVAAQARLVAVQIQVPEQLPGEAEVIATNLSDAPILNVVISVVLEMADGGREWLMVPAPREAILRPGQQHVGRVRVLPNLGLQLLDGFVEYTDARGRRWCRRGTEQPSPVLYWDKHLQEAIPADLESGVMWPPDSEDD